MSILRALCVIVAIVIAVGYTALWFAVPAPLERPCCTAPSLAPGRLHSTSAARRAFALLEYKRVGRRAWFAPGDLVLLAGFLAAVPRPTRV